MNAWICAAVVPIWPAAAPVSKTLVRQPCARLPTANWSAATRVAGFVMTSISSPQRRRMRSSFARIRLPFSSLEISDCCGRSHGDSTGVNVFVPPLKSTRTSTVFSTFSVRSAASYCAAGI